MNELPPAWKKLHVTLPEEPTEADLERISVNLAVMGQVKVQLGSESGEAMMRTAGSVESPRGGAAKLERPTFVISRKEAGEKTIDPSAEFMALLAALQTKLGAEIVAY